MALARVARAGPTETTEVTERSGVTYDKHGLVRTYRETLTDTATPDLTVTVDRAETAYDLMGRESGSTALRHEAGRTTRTRTDGTTFVESIDKWTTYLQSDRTFNPRGQISGYREATFDGVALNVGGRERAWSAL